MKFIIGLALSLVLTACAHREVRVRCDGKLQPINLPAPVKHGDAQ